MRFPESTVLIDPSKPSPDSDQNPISHPDPTSRKDKPDLHTQKSITPPSTLSDHPQKLSIAAKTLSIMSALQTVSVRPAGQVAGVRARVQPAGAVKAVTRRAARVQLRATADPTVRHQIQKPRHWCLFAWLPKAERLSRKFNGISV